MSDSAWTDTTPHPWRRYLARTFDMATGGVGLLVAAVFGLARYAPETWLAIGPFIDNGISTAILVPLATIPESAVLVGLTGGTPGKWLFGVRVLGADGRPVGLAVAIRRELLVWYRGLGLGLPVVSIVTALKAKGTLEETGRTSWDRTLALAVCQRPDGPRQVASFALGTALLAALVWFLGATGPLDS